MSAAASPISILLISSSEKGRDFLLNLLDISQFSPIICCGSSEEAKQVISTDPFDVILINSPLSDGSGVVLAADLAENTHCGIVLFVSGSVYDEVYTQMIPRGVLTVPKNSTRSTILQAIHLCAATNARLKAMEDRASTLEEKMKEGRLVSRAKLLLIEQLGMSEAAAHRYIEKQAMDQCVRKREIAESIIRTYSH